MKRRDLLRHLLRHGCEFLREGSWHSVYWNPGNLRVSTIPRHREIHSITADSICKDLGVPLPR